MKKVFQTVMLENQVSYGHVDGRTEGKTVGLALRRREEWMNQWTGGWTAGLTYRVISLNCRIIKPFISGNRCLY